MVPIGAIAAVSLGISAMEKAMTLQGMDVHEHLRDPGRKQRYVSTVFEIVATSYDRFTRLCSLGLDRAWKRELVALVKPYLRPDHQVLDLATGTGDLAFALAPFVRQGNIVGIDIAANMIARAEHLRRLRQVGHVEFRVADMMHLPLPAGSRDAVAVGYGLRNCPDVRSALGEAHRVLKPGGILASLDFVRPGNALWERSFLNGLLLACNFFGWLWHRQPAAYGYLAHSIAHFISMKELRRVMAEAGFQVLVQRPKLFGMVCIQLARKK
jgi:demethylmenaquinone methyltransferase/2-methoxy-6-polyprenyl-1,4-benzoquinol methylase